MAKKPGIYGPDDPEAQDILEVLQAVYDAQAAQQGLAEAVDDDDTLEGIAWNAVVMGHPNRFEDMPETTAFADVVVRKLMAANCLRPAAAPYALNAVAGFLRFLWDTQNLMYLDPEFARGQACALEQLIGELNDNWGMLAQQTWFEKVAAFPAQVDAGLQHIESQTWEGVYKVLDPTLQRLQTEALDLLADVERKHAEHLPSIAAFIAGSIIVKNSYSPLDGSVPESIGERLTKVYHALDADNEARYFPLLSKGFQEAQQVETNELDRWRDEDR